MLEEKPMRLSFDGLRSRTRGTLTRHGTDARLHVALRKMAITHNAPPASLVSQVPCCLQYVLQFGFNRLFDQLPGALAKNLRKWILNE
jgi:hypothetical protein